MNPSRLYVIGILLVLVGFGIAAVGSLGSSSGSFGGAIFIGPFPIVFGSGPDSGLLALMALIIGLVMVVTFSLWVLLGRKARSRDEEA